MLQSTKTFVPLLVLVAAGMMLAPFLIVAAPNESTMGFVYHIIFFHVPSAWLCFLSVFVAAAASGVYLAKDSRKADAVAIAAAELAVVFGLCVLVTGPLWARKSWGVWWVWKDVRLMTTLLLWIIFVAYVLVRRFGGPGSARLAAGLSIFAAADVPIIYTSVFFWRTQHPKATVVTTLPASMRPAFFTSLAVFTVMYLVLLAMRLRVETARQRLDDAWLAAEDAGLLDDDAAPAKGNTP